LSVLINGKHISALTEFSIVEAKEFFDTLELTKKENEIATMILKEINDRLLFLINVGLKYLTLSRASGTLSGGEAKSIRLATIIGSALTGVVYVLYNPSLWFRSHYNVRLICNCKILLTLCSSSYDVSL